MINLKDLIFTVNEPENTANRPPRGKALIYIEKLDSKWIPFDVRVYQQSGCCELDEDWNCLSSDALPLPTAAYKLKTGDRIWVNVVFDFRFTRDYWGESDVELTYKKEKVIKRIKSTNKKYRY